MYPKLQSSCHIHLDPLTTGYCLYSPLQPLPAVTHMLKSSKFTSDFDCSGERTDLSYLATCSYVCMKLVTVPEWFCYIASSFLQQTLWQPSIYTWNMAKNILWTKHKIMVFHTNAPTYSNSRWETPWKRKQTLNKAESRPTLPCNWKLPSSIGKVYTVHVTDQLLWLRIIHKFTQHSMAVTCWGNDLQIHCSILWECLK